MKAELWKQYGPDDPYGMKLPPMNYVVASLYTAFTEKEENDASALVILGVWTDRDTGFENVMLIYAWQDRLALHDLVTRVKHTCDKYRIDTLLIENKASGIDVHHEMMRLYARHDWGVTFCDPTRAGSKSARAHSVSHLLEEGMVYAPNTEWAEMVQTQCMLFPKGSHDDLVDSLVQGLRYLRDNGLLARRAEQRAAERDAETYKGRGARKALYAA